MLIMLMMTLMVKLNLRMFYYQHKENVLKKVEKLANNVGRRLILPWNLGTRRGSRGPKTLFKYIAFYWTMWWTSVFSLFNFVF